MPITIAKTIQIPPNTRVDTDLKGNIWGESQPLENNLSYKQYSKDQGNFMATDIELKNEGSSQEWRDVGGPFEGNFNKYTTYERQTKSGGRKRSRRSFFKRKSRRMNKQNISRRR
jgi:hypothetical protein